MQQQPTINMPLDLVNGVLGYLGTRPYQEVFNLIQGIQSTAQAQSVIAQAAAPKAEDAAPAPEQVQ